MVITEQMGQAPRRRSTDLLNAQLGNFGNQFVGKPPTQARRTLRRACPTQSYHPVLKEGSDYSKYLPCQPNIHLTIYEMACNHFLQGPNLWLKPGGR